MEIKKLIQEYYSLGDDIIKDDDINQHIEKMVIERFEIVGYKTKNTHLYSLIITKTPTRIDYHQFSFEKLQEISRKFTNGMVSFGNITNRNFWNLNILGGVRTTSIIQKEINEYPSFSINYLVYSNSDNLDVKIKKQLLIRLKLIDPNLEFSFKYLGKYDPKIIKENIRYQTDVNYSSPNILKLDSDTLDNIYNNQYQRPRFLGKLFKNKSKRFK